MSSWSKTGKRTCLLEPNGFITSDQGKVAKVPGPNSYNTQSSPKIRGTIAHPPYEKPPYTKSDRDKILSNGVKVSTISPIGPGEYSMEDERGGAPPPGMQSPTSSPTKGSNNSPRKSGGGGGSSGEKKGRRSNSPLGFGGSSRRPEIYDTKDVPGPGSYEIKLPAVSNRGKFLSTSPRKVCSPVEKERPPQLSPTQQEWFNRTSGSLGNSNERGGSGDQQQIPSPPLDGSFNKAVGSSIRRSVVSPPNLSPRALQQQSGSWGPSTTISPTLSGSFGRSPNSSQGNYARDPKSPRVKGGYIASSPRTMNMHNPNSSLAREKDPDFANPAPGAYDSNSKKSSDRHLGGKISQSPRNTSLISPKVGLIPGPGSYDADGGGSFAGTSAIQI